MPAQALSTNAVPSALAASSTNRATREPSFAELCAAAERARSFESSLLGGAAGPVLVADHPIEAQLGGPLLAEKVQNATVELGGRRAHLINQDLLYRVPSDPVRAFKQGFFGQAQKVGARMTVIAVEQNGRWMRGGTDEVFADPSVGRVIIRASLAQIGTDLPGVAPATAFLSVDRRSLRETKDACSFTISFLNPWNQRGLFPPYVDAVGRYGIHDHKDGTATVYAYWLGDAGTELIEPTLRETSAGKLMKSGWDSVAHAFDGVPLIGWLARGMAGATEQATLAVAKSAVAIGDAALSASGATEELFPIAALQHVRFYERDWCNPERWGQVAAERNGHREVQLRSPARKSHRLPRESEPAFAERAWRLIRGADPVPAIDAFERA